MIGTRAPVASSCRAARIQGSFSSTLSPSVTCTHINKSSFYSKPALRSIVPRPKHAIVYSQQRPSASSGSGGGNHIGGRRGQRGKKARQPGVFEVRVVTPPPRSLGIYALNDEWLHNGQEIEVDGKGYVVTSLVIMHRLEKGKYVRDHTRLDVQPTGRYFLNMMLENLVKAKYLGPTGLQD